MQDEYGVVLCTYNGEKYIIEQLQSILEQSFKPKKIYIFDDRSTDQTVDVLMDFISSEVIKVDIEINVNDFNKGYARNFLDATQSVQEEILLFSDQDDVWCKDKAFVFMEAFKNNPEKNLVFSDAYITDSSLNNTNCSLSELLAVDQSLLTFDSTFIKRNVVTGAVMGVRRQWLHMLPKSPEEIPHDYWLATVASLSQSILWLNNKTVYYRQHDNNQLGARESSIFERFSNIILGRFLLTRKNSLEQRFKISQAISFEMEASYLKFIRNLMLFVDGNKIGFIKYCDLLLNYYRYDFGGKYLIADIYLHVTNRIK